MHSITGEIREVRSRLVRGLAVRGVVAVAFGVVLFVWPRPSLLALTYVLGVMAAADGAIAIGVAATEAPRGERWWLALAGVAGIATAITVFTWPEVTTRVLLYLVGAWALMMGVLEVAGAFFGQGTGSGRHVVALQGLISAAFGVIMLARPGSGAVVLVSLVAAFAIARGVTLCGIAREMHRANGAVAPPVHPDAHASAA